MKKSYLYAIIIVMSIVVVIMAILVFKSNGKDIKEETNFKDSNEKIVNKITFNSIEEKSGVFEVFYDVSINGENKSLEIEFGTSQGVDYDTIYGGINRQTVYSDVQEAKDINPNAEELTEEYIKKNFNEDNFKFIKGEDGKYYIAVVYKQSDYTDLNYYLLLFNDDFKKIENENLAFQGAMQKDFTIITTMTGFDTLDNSNPWFEDSFKICNNRIFSLMCNINVRILNDSIEYFQITGKNGDNYTMEKRVYTINNNKLSYKVDSKYIVKPVAGQLQ